MFPLTSKPLMTRSGLPPSAMAVWPTMTVPIQKATNLQLQSVCVAVEHKLCDGAHIQTTCNYANNDRADPESDKTADAKRVSSTRVSCEACVINACVMQSVCHQRVCHAKRVSNAKSVSSTSVSKVCVSVRRRKLCARKNASTRAMVTRTYAQTLALLTAWQK
jgi:hypothetical protein